MAGPFYSEAANYINPDMINNKNTTAISDYQTSRAYHYKIAALKIQTWQERRRVKLKHTMIIGSGRSSDMPLNHTGCCLKSHKRQETSGFSKTIDTQYVTK